MPEEAAESPRVRVLFVRVHNSARSQMAEALLRHLAPDSCVVESAGFEPRPVLPDAVRAMSLLGLDISGASSKAVFDLYRAGRIFDYVIAVCDAATAERCPIFPGVCEREHWSFADPSAAEGTDAERLRQVIQIRDQIKLRLEAWLAEKQAAGCLSPVGTLRQHQRKG